MLRGCNERENEDAGDAAENCDVAVVYGGLGFQLVRDIFENLRN